MSENPRTPTAERLFDSLLERQATVFDAIRSNSERYHRFNRSIIEGARQTSRDWTEVNRRWLTNPTDLIGVYEAVSEAFGNGQARALALSREWFEDAVETQRESREVFRQGIGDVREVVERAQANVPQIFRRNSERTNGGRPQAVAEK